MTEDSSRPDLMPAVKRLAIIEVATILAMLLVSATAWMRIPQGARIAVHWGAAGQPDQFTSKIPGLLWMPGVALFVSVLMLAFLVIPKREAVTSLKAYVSVSASVLGLLLGFHLVAVFAAMGREVNMPALVLTLLGGMFIVIGNYFTKMRRNRWMGVRTPWTRASEYCWDRTHRLASRLFVGFGIIMIAVAWSGMNPIYQGAVMLTGVLGVTLAVYIYSYVVWITNPGR